MISASLIVRRTNTSSRLSYSAFSHQRCNHDGPYVGWVTGSVIVIAILKPRVKHGLGPERQRAEQREGLPIRCRETRSKQLSTRPVRRPREALKTASASQAAAGSTRP